MDIQRGQTAWECGMDMQHRHAVYILKTCSKDIRCSIDMGKQHRQSTEKRNKGKQHGNAASTYSMYTWHGHATWRSGMDAA
jgi:hypothetical protein